MVDRTVTYRLRSDVTGLLAGTKAASESLKKLGNDAIALNKEGVKFRQGLGDLGSLAGKFGLVAAAGLGAAVLKSAEFDAAMSKVSAATGESAENMEKLRQAALDAGAQTVFSATEAADGVEQLAKAGVSTADILGGGLKGALDLAAAGEISVGEAAEVAAKAMTQFGLSGDQVPHIADLLAAAAGSASGEVGDFGMALSQAGLVADQVGLSLEETTGGLAAFASAGLLGSDAGTSFKSMLGALTPNSDKAAKAMERIGLSAYDAQGNFIGLSEFAGKLQSSLSDMTVEQRQATLETIFGSDAVRAASVLYEQGAEGIAEWTDKVDQQGAAAEMAGARLDNLKGDFEALGGAVETTLIGVGDSSQGPLRAVTQGVTAMVNDFGDLPGAAQTATAAVMAGSAAIGGSVWVGGKVVQGIANTSEALTNLGYDGDKATRAMKGLAAAGAGLAILGAAAVAIRAIQEATADSLPGVETLTGRLIDLANTPSEFSASLGSEFDSLGDSIDRITDKTADEKFGDFMQTPFEGLVGEGGGLREARNELDALDTSLAGLASSGNADIAADALANLVEQYGLSESQTEGLLSQLPKYDESLASIENQTKLTGAAAETATASADGLGSAMDEAAQDAQNLKDKMDSLNAVLDGRSDMRDYQAAIDDFAASLKENGNNFDINTDKGRKNQAALDGIAGSALAVADNLSGAARQKFLTNAISDIRTMGENMGLPKAEIKRLIDLLRQANEADVKPKIDVDTRQSLSKIAAVANSIANLRDRSLTITTVYDVVRNTNDALPYRGKADGGYISGPGTGTSDSIPSYLSNGEYVIKAAAVNKYGTHMFDSLNAMHFAEGGSTDKKKKPVRGVAFYSPDNANALQAAIDRLTDVASTQTEALEAATSAQEFWAGKMSDLAQATVSGFNTGLFDEGASGRSRGALSNLSTDIAGLTERQGLQTQLAGMGLSGDALSALLSEGSNKDISGLIASGQVSQYADLYGQRAALQGSVGMQAGQAAYGVQAAQASADAAAARVEMQKLQIEMARANTLLARTAAASERMSDDAPERMGAEVGRVIKSTSADAGRSGAHKGGRRV